MTSQIPESPTFPADIESLTSDWLTRVLRARGILEGETSICGFSSAAISGGYTSSVYRILLDYQGDQVAGPTSLVAKFHGVSASTRESFEALGLYEKEVRFYQYLGKDRSLPVPVCYCAEFDEVTGDFVLLMEDLAAARESTDNQILGDIQIALAHLAKIHSAFWDSPKLLQYDWIVQPSDLANPPPLKGIWAKNLDQAKRQFCDQHSGYTWSVCEKWLEHWDDIMVCMSRDAHTLDHTDAHLDQMFFPTETFPRFILFDWQYPCKGWGAEDVAHLVVSDLTVESRRREEQSLIDLYYNALHKQGVRDLTKERFWFQCKLCLLWLLFMNLNTILDTAMLKMLISDGEQYQEDWREWMFNRVGAATEDWQLSEILDQAIEEGRNEKF